MPIDTPRYVRKIREIYLPMRFGHTPLLNKKPCSPVSPVHQHETVGHLGICPYLRYPNDNLQRRHDIVVLMCYHSSDANYSLVKSHYINPYLFIFAGQIHIVAVTGQTTLLVHHSLVGRLLSAMVNPS